MSGQQWKGWVCGKCRERLTRDQLVARPVRTHRGPRVHLHAVDYLADYCGDQPRYETAYCGPVRHYPRRTP